MIKFICSPGIGHLDNALPLIDGLNNKIKFPCSIFFTKENMIPQLINNPTLLRLHNKYFKKKYLIINNKVILFYEIRKINNFLKNRILNLLFFYFLIPLNISAFNNLILKYFNFEILDLKKVFSENDIIIYDPFENNKNYFKKIKILIEKNFKLGLRHGIGNDYFSNNEKSIKINNLIYLSHSKKQTLYVKKKFNLSDNKIINSGILKYSKYWKKIILGNTKRKFFNKKNNFVYVISRHNTNYFNLERKQKLIKILKKILIDDLNLKLVIKFHPKEDPTKSKKIYEKILGSHNMNKTWFIVNDHSFYISKICKFGISYISSVALDILSFNKSTIEILNLDKKRNEKKINFSFSKNSLVYQPFKVNNFKSIVNNVLQRKKYTNYLIKNFRRNYYSENNKKTIKLINKIYYEHCNNMR